MSHRLREKVCIKTRKVYDWVTRQVDVPLISVSNEALDGKFVCHFDNDEGNICDILCQKGIDPSTLSVDCFLSDAEGNKIDPIVDHKSLLCQEIKQAHGRPDVTVTLPNGNETTLQRVKVLIKGHVVAQILDAAGREICRSCPIPFATAQSFLLCAPEGTELDCHISFVDCDASLICTSDFQQLDVALTLCIEVQMEADVKLEIEGRFCEPREEILEGILCPVRKFPPQCPEVFPTH
ncbi:MAG: hypothetical protein LPK00_07525 [Bacillaceae bacterium]|nr:hypothetical protein [Bacillaceae bacterium]